MTVELVPRCFAVLDRAIARVAEREFARLREGLREDEVAAQIANAFRELRKLQRSDGEPPDYNNPWVAVLYILWYQPGQTYLAYRVVCQMVQYRVSPQLHVVDVGCGAIATEIALRIATATGVTNTAAVPLHQSVVHSIDLSSEMIRLGKQVADELCTDPEMAELHDHRTCRRNVINSHLTNLSARQADEDWWLTALHAVYDNNVQDIRSQVEAITSRASPLRGIVTTHSSKSHLLGEACGLDAAKAQLFPRSPIVNVRFLPGPSQVCRVRALMLQVVSTALERSGPEDGLQMAANYLKRNPTWFQSIGSTVYIAPIWTG